MINHYYYYRLQAESRVPPCTPTSPISRPRDPGYVESTSPRPAVLKSSKHQAAAQEIRRVPHRRGRADRARPTRESFEYPLNAGVAANPKLPPLSGYQPNSFTLPSSAPG